MISTIPKCAPSNPAKESALVTTMYPNVEKIDNMLNTMNIHRLSIHYSTNSSVLSVRSC